MPRTTEEKISIIRKLQNKIKRQGTNRKGSWEIIQDTRGKSESMFTILNRHN